MVLHEDLKILLCCGSFAWLVFQSLSDGGFRSGSNVIRKKCQNYKVKLSSAAVTKMVGIGV